jgi:hypothetical protein
MRKILLVIAVSLAAGAAQAAVVITVDKSAQRMSVKVDGVERHNWPVSTGKTGYSTPSGAFTPFRLEEDHYSKEWDEAPMPHSVFFTKQGHAIHGSLDTKRLGMPASHGCVRLSPAHAAVLFKLVKDEGLGNSKVVLTGDEQIALQRRKSGTDVASAPAAAAPQRRASVDDYAARMRRRYYEQQYGAAEPQPRAYGQGYYQQQPAYQTQQQYYVPQYGNSGYGGRY